MITSGEGGVIQSMMPPANWNFGPIPEECYDGNLSKREIEVILKKVYLEEDRVRKLADSDDKIEILKAKIAIEIVAEIDANTVWCYNLTQKEDPI